jgi:tetratricopeptide (TPR) repeat protein
MKKTLFLLILLIMVLWGMLPAQSDQDDFEKAKILIFDEQWAAALKQLDGMLAAYPAGRYSTAALFYRAKCQAELGARKPALASYEQFVKAQPGSPLNEDALISIIDLAAELFAAGEKEYLQKIVVRLKHENKVVSYYAAFKLSYLSDRGQARQALPVLNGIMEREKDAELRDRARIAIMRIDPSRATGAEPSARAGSGKMLKIRILGKKSKEAEISLNIPLGLADLAIRSLSEEQKRSLRKQGYNLDDVLAQLTGQGLKIDFQDEDSVFRIWVE